MSDLRALRLGTALVLLVVEGACAAHYASPQRGGSVRDPLVHVFAADRERTWPSFRLGGGLNVVVTSSDAPREFAWRVETGGISSSPTVMDGVVLVSANDDHLYAIDATTGALRWRYRAENQIMSQPGYKDGMIYVGIGNSGHRVFDPPYFIVTGEGMNKLEAIDARTGIEQWWTGLAGTGMPSAAIVGDTVISIDGAGTVLAVDARSGAYRWHRSLPSAFAMSSVTADGNGHVYFAGHLQNAVYALRTSDGAPLWTHRFSDLDGAMGTNPLALDGTTLVGMYLEARGPGRFGPFVTEGSLARQHVFALDARTGAMLWDRTLVSETGHTPRYNESAIPLIYGGHVYIGSAVAPVVTALDLHGDVLWQRRVDGTVKGGIVARDGVLYFGDLSGHLWALEARTGAMVGTVATDMIFNTGSPIILNDSLVEGGRTDVIGVPLEAIRSSREVGGVTQLTPWEHAGRSIARLLPHRDPHLEASYRGP